MNQLKTLVTDSSLIGSPGIEVVELEIEEIEITGLDDDQQPQAEVICH